MKKIYMILAVLALLTLSLNAQMLPYKAEGKEYVYLDRGKPASSAGLFRAPAKINTADGEFLVGPYTTDYFSTTGIGLYNTIQSEGRVDITAILDRSEIEQYIGQEIVGYRFATTGTVSCYSFLISSEGPNHWISDIDVFNIQSSGEYVDVSGTQWHEYYLDEPVTFAVPDSVIAVWIGYRYYQESSSTAGNTYSMTPILVNPNSTSHDTYAYAYGTQQFYDVTSTLGGDLAAQLIFKAPSGPKITASPTSVSMSTTPGGTKTETVTVTGTNLTSGITATISGTDASLFSVSPASLGTSGGSLTVTYSPTAVGNHTATLTLSSTGAQDVVITLNGTCASDITICDGTNNNNYLPIYGLYCDDYQINQMIYPEDLLTDLVGKTLTSMTFYATENLDAKLSSVGWNVKLGTTTQASFADALSSITRLVPDDVTTVAEGYVITSGINTMTITFTTPFTYNGGNLLVDFQSTAEGQYKSTYFYGVNQSTYTGYNSYRSSDSTPNQNGHYSQGGPRQFLPTVTFTYENSTNPELAISPADQTINDNAAGTLTVTGTDITGNISVSAADNTNWSLNPTSLSSNGGNVNVTYTGRDLSASTTVTASATSATDATATVNYVADLYIVTDNGQTGNWDFTTGTHMSYNNGIYTATFTANADNTYILFARLLDSNQNWNTRNVFGPDSNGDWWLTGDSGSGNLDLNDDDPIKIVNGGTYTVTINANDGTFTITKPSEGQTATPTITYTVSDEYVTITATGDGTVTLNVPGYNPVSGEGEASITIPRGYASNTITVTATAQEDGKTESAPASEQITIPAGSGWTEMDGTYSANDLLSFTVGGEDIMLVDQFMASTLNNGQPDHYTYTLRQTVNGETNTSTPVEIPVYKTNSSIQGLYTQNQVDGDTDMKLKAGVLNTEMDYDVNPDHNVLYYSLYRSGLNETYPAIDVDSRISQLQKFEDNASGTVQYFMYENHTSGVTPRYDHLGNEIAERLDTNWVEGAYNDQLAYVPVIWTFGLYSGREDGKNNSYGSDIKREYLGKVEATISGEYTAGNAYGTWDVNGTEYCVFHPTINVTGYLPQEGVTIHYNDGDEATYVPYKCRAWCTTEGIHDFVKDSEGHLTDNGTLDVPYLLGEAEFGNDLTATIGGDWTGLDNDPHSTDVRDQWSFGLPSTTNPASITYVIRFYYKKDVTEGNAGTGSKLRDGDSQEYFIVQTSGTIDEWIVGLNELNNYSVVESVTYVNPQGMQSSRPFDGVNIVVTRYSDGTTRTSKIIR